MKEFPKLDQLINLVDIAANRLGTASAADLAIVTASKAIVQELSEISDTLREIKVALNAPDLPPAPQTGLPQKSKAVKLKA